MKRCLVDQDIKPVSRLEERLDGELDVSVGVDTSEDDLIAKLDGKEVLFTTSRLPVSDRVLTETDLELVAKLGTGIDNVDLETARERGIPVTYTPGLNAISVAEHTLALLLAISRRLNETQDILRDGGWRDEAPFGTELHGKTIGIIGYGNIGSRVGSLLAGFHPDLLAHDPYIADIDVEYAGAELVPLDRLLRESDAVTINAELTAETRGMIGSRELAMMKPSALLVNAARGPIVQEDALIAALREGEIAGAGLDVFETEPPSASSPLHDLENVVTTPHIAGVTFESRHRTIDRLAESVLALLDGRDVPTRYLAVPPAE